MTPLLSFDERAVEQFQRLWVARIRFGTMDLKIAAITLANDAVLLSRNLTVSAKSLPAASKTGHADSHPMHFRLFWKSGVVVPPPSTLASLVFVQFLLLTVALQGYLRGHGGMALPTALASGVCFAAACWLIRYLLLPGWR